MSAGGDDSAYSDKLAKRSKRRRWWEKWKTRVVVTTILVVTFLVLGAFTPYLPQKYHDYIMENYYGLTKGQGTQIITEDAARKLYRLGRFYGMTMREKKAGKCYGQLEQWYYGYNARKLMRVKDLGHSAAMFTEAERKFGKDHRKKKIKLSPGAIKWVLYGMAEHCEWLWAGKKKQQAKLLSTKYYIPLTEKYPKQHDVATTRRIKVKILRYNQGG